MTGPTPFERALGAELEAAIERDQQRRHRTWAPRIGLVAAAVVVAAMVVALTLPGSGPATADVDIRTTGRVIEAVVAVDVDPQELVDAIRDQGLQAEIVEVPTGPSRVGFVVGQTVSDGAEVVSEVGPDGSPRQRYRLPVRWTGTLVVSVGRPARAGEPYDAPTDAFAAGEPLHCSHLLGRPLVDAAPDLADLDVVVTSTSSAEVQNLRLSLASAAQSDLGRWVVTSAQATSADRLLLTVSSPGTPPPPDPCTR